MQGIKVGNEETGWPWVEMAKGAIQDEGGRSPHVTLEGNQVPRTGEAGWVPRSSVTPEESQETVCSKRWKEGEGPRRERHSVGRFKNLANFPFWKFPAYIKVGKCSEPAWGCSAASTGCLCGCAQFCSISTLFPSAFHRLLCEAKALCYVMTGLVGESWDLFFFLFWWGVVLMALTLGLILCCLL